jgi:protein SCO1/2
MRDDSITRRRRSSLVLAFCCCLSLVTLAGAQEGLPPALQGIRIEQKLDAQVPLDLEFRDESGAPVRLNDLIGDKPVILTLVYYECPMLCTLVLNGLVKSMNALPFEVGREFAVVSVSIDPGEAPELATSKKDAYLKMYNKEGAREGWRFLTGDLESIDRLAEAVGFHYEYDPSTDQFAHAAGIMVLTPKGRVARYFYGIEYSARDLRLALVEASENRIGGLADQILLFCYHYDPATGEYGPATFFLMRVGGAITVFGIGLFVLYSLRREKRAVRRLPT